MSVTFKNGPASDISLLIRRAPLFLRVVQKGKVWDALDQLHDIAALDEKVYCYRRVEPLPEVGWIHLNRGRGKSGTFKIASYEYVTEQPPEEALRSNMAWRKWCASQVEPPAEETGNPCTTANLPPSPKTKTAPNGPTGSQSSSPS